MKFLIKSKKCVKGHGKKDADVDRYMNKLEIELIGKNLYEHLYDF